MLTVLVCTLFLAGFNRVFGRGVTGVSNGNATLYIVANLFDEPFDIYPK